MVTAQVWVAFCFMWCALNNQTNCFYSLWHCPYVHFSHTDISLLSFSLLEITFKDYWYHIFMIQNKSKCFSGKISLKWKFLKLDINYFHEISISIQWQSLKKFKHSLQCATKTYLCYKFCGPHIIPVVLHNTCNSSIQSLW